MWEKHSWRTRTRPVFTSRARTQTQSIYITELWGSCHRHARFRSMMLNVWRSIRRSVQRLERTSRITSQSIALDSMCHFGGQASRWLYIHCGTQAIENSPFIYRWFSQFFTATILHWLFLGDFPASHVWWHQRVSISVVSAVRQQFQPKQVKLSVPMQRLKSCEEMQRTFFGR